MTHKYGESIAKIRELCARDIGVSTAEAAKELHKTMNYTYVYLAAMVKNKEVTRTGSCRDFRYFTDPEHAFAHEEAEKLVAMARAAAARKRKTEMQKIREKRKRAEARAAKPPVPLLDKKDSKLPKKKATGISLITKQRELEQKREHLKAKIEWPAHVKVQVIPTYQDNRFKPAPGHKGAFLAEWKEKRAA